MDEKWKRGFKKQMIIRHEENEKKRKIRKIQFYKASEAALPKGGKLRIPPQNLWLLVGTELDRKKYAIPYPFAIRTATKTAKPSVTRNVKCPETHYRVYIKKTERYMCRQKPKPKQPKRQLFATTEIGTITTSLN